MEYLNSIKKNYKSPFMASYSSFTTTEFSIILSSRLLRLKHVLKYCETVYEKNSNNLFWSIKNSGEILNK